MTDKWRSCHEAAAERNAALTGRIANPSYCAAPGRLLAERKDTMSVRSLAQGILAAAGLLAASGCGGGGLKTHPVNGIVTLDDKPVEGALVQFMPMDDRGRPATGMTRSDGTFRLRTYITGDGAVAGTYKVLVSKSEERNRPGPESKNPEEMKNRMMAAAKKAAAVSRDQSKSGGIPAVYSSPQSELLATVPTNGPVELKLRSTGGS